MNNDKPATPTDKRILVAAEMFNVHPRDLVGHYKFSFLLLPRFALTKALREVGLSSPRIGQIVRRDHTSVLYQLKQADNFMQRDPGYAKKVNQLISKFQEMKNQVEKFYEG